jgi:hypothetical protein
MHLINCADLDRLKLEEFSAEGDFPKYAILSHTWSSQEATFNELPTPPAVKYGVIKILLACAQAIKDGYRYLWVDTCCIDKSNSVELSESINSMFHWYKQAEVCYVYLSDVTHGECLEADILKSRWWTRGWTLQELLAPRKVHFFHSGWLPVGDKRSLAQAISRRTGIAEEVLFDSERIFQRSVSERMSWAAERQTTRPEDRAYCLLGIFGTNLTPIYGERERAFVRLQEKIIEHSFDESIFAWGVTEDRVLDPSQLSGADVCHMGTSESGSLVETGAFAETPADFARGNEVQRMLLLSSPECEVPRLPFKMTNRGIQISLPVINADDPRNNTFAWKDAPSRLIGLLSCKANNGHFVAILLNQCIAKNRYARLRSRERGSTVFISARLAAFALKREILLLHTNDYWLGRRDQVRFYDYMLQIVLAPDAVFKSRYDTTEVYVEGTRQDMNEEIWNAKDSILTVTDRTNLARFVFSSPTTRAILTLDVGPFHQGDAVPMTVHPGGSAVATAVEKRPPIEDGDGDSHEDGITAGQRTTGARFEISYYSNIVLDRRMVVLDVKCLA